MSVGKDSILRAANAEAKNNAERLMRAFKKMEVVK